MRDIEQAKSEWLIDIPLFFEQVLGFSNDCGRALTDQQFEAVSDLSKFVNARLKKMNGLKLEKFDQQMLKKRGMAIRSGQGPGKTTMAAGILLWMLVCCPLGSVMAVLGTKEQQIKAGIWREFRTIMRYAKEYAATLGIRCLLDDLVMIHSEYVYPKVRGALVKDSFIQLKTINLAEHSDSQAESIAGLHAPFMGLVVDEASAVPDKVFESFLGTMTGDVNFILAISNPTRKTGYFREIFRRYKDRWLTYHWNCEKSPIVSEDAISDLRKSCGPDSTVYRIRVLGEFPEVDKDALIDWDDLMECMELDLPIIEHDPVIIGIDVAFAGQDECALVVRKGMKILDISTLKTESEQELIVWIAEYANKYKHSEIIVDSNGVGRILESRLRELGYNTLGIVGHQKSRTDIYRYLRDELWFKLADVVKRGFIDLSILKHTEHESHFYKFVAPVTKIKYKHLPNGEVKVESNDDLRRRGERSPDIADALCLTYFVNDDMYRPINADIYADDYGEDEMTNYSHWAL